MEERQDPKQRVVRPYVGPTENSFDLAEKIAMRQHDPLGIGGRTGCIEDGCDVVGWLIDRSKTVCAMGNDVVEINGLVGRSTSAITIDKNGYKLRLSLIYRCQVLGVAEQQRSPAIF